MSNVFIGDSVTDCDRLTFPPLGNGWVREIVNINNLQDVINVGISGNRLVDLELRWHRDVIENKPTRLTIDIGINDMWRRYDRNEPTSVEEFEASYDNLLRITRLNLDLELVLCEPFLLHVRPEMKIWREDLDPKISVVHKMAAKYQAKLVKFDEMFAKLSEIEGNEIFALDGVHPTDRGHSEMANLWISEVLNR